MVMETEPDYTNVVFIDEYPEIKKRVWLRRLAQERLGQQVVGSSIVFLPDLPKPPDDAA